MAELNSRTLADLKKGLTAKEFSASELTEDCIKAMEARRDDNIFVTETPDQARAAAKRADERIAKGEALPLDGIPFGIKDNFCTLDTLSTAGSKILGNFVPAYESSVTAKLWNAGAVLLGKTNLDEFAMGSTTESSHFGATVNPKSPAGKKLVPGGSSGGSAAVVAADVAPAALGSDTGGSIRQPASFCGVVGMKPTYGRCSRWGIAAYASSLDQAGPLAKTVEDVALILNVICGFDEKDSTSLDQAVPDFTKALRADVKGKTIGIPKEYRETDLPEEISRIWDEGIKAYEAAGATVKEVSLPHTKYALPAYYIIAMAEASSNLARYDGVRYGFRADGNSLDEMYINTRTEGFGAEVKRRIMLGTYILSAGYYEAYYVKAQKVRTLVRNDFVQAFQEVDALLFPTTPGPAFELGSFDDDPVGMYLQDIFTVPINLAGLPAISVPFGLDAGGLPIGLQVVTKALDEETALSLAGVLEG